jgi:hypothetical protein
MFRFCFIVMTLIALPLVAACSKSNDWTEEQRQNAERVIRALEERNEATRLSNNVGPGPGERNKYIPIIAHMRQAYDHATVVEDEVLTKIHPDLKEHWKGEFIAGLRLRLSNLEGNTGDTAAEMRGSALLDAFGEWLNAHSKEIRIPK